MREQAVKMALEKAAVERAMKNPFPAPPRQPIGHVLKCWPQQFQDIIVGEKHFEVRKDDRDFAVGDTVILVEYDPETKQHSGRSTTRSIGYLGRGVPYPLGYCAFMLTYGEAACTLAPPMQGRVR